MSERLFINTGRETIKGGALQALKDAGNAGAYAHAVLSLSGAVVDTETFSLGDDTYEINAVTVDTTQDTGTGGEFNNTSAVVNVPVTGQSAGDVLRVGSEFMLVLSATATSAYVLRGFAGSTVVAHGNSQTIFGAAQQVGADNLAVPVSGTGATTADDQIVAAVNFWGAGYRKGLGGGIGVDVENKLKVTAVLAAASTIAFGYPKNGDVVSTAETFTNGTLSAFINGFEPAETKYSRLVVTSGGTGAENFFAPFDVTRAGVTVYAADGSAEAIAVTATVLASRVVQIGGAGKAAGQTLVVEMFE